MGYRTWIYHESEDPKIIDSDDYVKFEGEGWANTPAKFIKIPDFKVDADDPVAVQQLGDSIQGVVDNLNGALNLSEMSHDELEAYALEHFNVDIDKRKKKKANLRLVKKLVDGDKRVEH